MYYIKIRTSCQYRVVIIWESKSEFMLCLNFKKHDIIYIKKSRTSKDVLLSLYWCGQEDLKRSTHAADHLAKDDQYQRSVTAIWNQIARGGLSHLTIRKNKKPNWIVWLSIFGAVSDDKSELWKWYKPDTTVSHIVYLQLVPFVI